MKSMSLIKKPLNKTTTVEISPKDVSFWQEGDLVVISNEEILEIAQMIEDEREKNES